jgi:hypothetical protein
MTRAVLTLLFLASGSVAGADQFRITTGTASGDDSSASLTIAGSGFTFSLFGETTGEISSLGSVFCPHPCDPTAVNFTARLSGLLGSGSAQIGGTSYSNVEFQGFLDFAGGPTTIQYGGDGSGLVQGPFAFTGLFTGFSGGTQLFSHTATGQGDASLRFLSGNANQGVSLTFSDDTAPVPEPATLLLLATGAAGIAARRRRQILRERAQPPS